MTVEDPDALRAIMRELVDTWSTTDRTFTSRKDVQIDRAAVVYGLAAHTHCLAGSILRMYENAEYFEALPTIRAAFEHALTAQWVSQVPDGANSFYNESLRQRKNLAATVSEIGWEKAADAISELDRAQRLPSSADDAAKRIHIMCDDLEPAGKSAYAMYRILCSYTHASSRTVDAYLSAEPLQVFAYPQGYVESDSRIWLFISCASLVWAARAFDMLEFGSPRMNELRRVAKRLEIAPQFRVSASAMKREQDYRRSQWKGPRSTREARRQSAHD